MRTRSMALMATATVVGCAVIAPAQARADATGGPSWVSPQAGAFVSGTVNLGALTSDPTVTFVAGGVTVGTVHGSGNRVANIDFDTTASPNGLLTLTVTGCQDTPLGEAGCASDTEQVTVNNVPPGSQGPTAPVDPYANQPYAVFGVQPVDDLNGDGVPEVVDHVRRQRFTIYPSVLEVRNGADGRLLADLPDPQAGYQAPGAVAVQLAYLSLPVPGVGTALVLVTTRPGLPVTFTAYTPAGGQLWQTALPARPRFADPRYAVSLGYERSGSALEVLTTGFDSLHTVAAELTRIDDATGRAVVVRDDRALGRARLVDGVQTGEYVVARDGRRGTTMTDYTPVGKLRWSRLTKTISENETGGAGPQRYQLVSDGVGTSLLDARTGTTLWTHRGTFEASLVAQPTARRGARVVVFAPKGKLADLTCLDQRGRVVWHRLVPVGRGASPYVLTDNGDATGDGIADPVIYGIRSGPVTNSLTLVDGATGKILRQYDGDPVGPQTSAFRIADPPRATPLALVAAPHPDDTSGLSASSLRTGKPVWTDSFAVADGFAGQGVGIQDLEPSSANTRTAIVVMVVSRPGVGVQDTHVVDARDGAELWTLVTNADAPRPGG